MPDYPPQLRWLYVPDTGHLLVLADAYDPVNRTVRVLDLSLERQVRGVQLPVSRVPTAALVRPHAYPATLLGEWKKQAWARWRIWREEQDDKARRDGPCSWNSKSRAHACNTRRRKHRPNNKFLKHRRR